jgi:pyruvate,water dikinase
VSIPPGCEGWAELYPYHAVFSEDRRAFEQGRFWFQDAIHCAEPIRPFDALWLDCGIAAFNQACARLFVVPPSLGFEYRILGGYVYFSGNAVTDEATLARRGELFAERGGHYYRHWNDFYAHWQQKVAAAIRDLEGLEVPDLPELEDEVIVTEGRGWGSSHALLVAYDRLREGFDRIWQYHFELNNLGYGAYLVLYELCREVFPGIEDQTVATMVSGIDVVLWRPDEELKRLARLALELGVAAAVKAATSEHELQAALAHSEQGARWLADLEQTKDPWFHFSYGNGLYSHHRSWIDDTARPIATIGSYIERLEAGGDIGRPYDAVIAERDRVTEEHRALVAGEARLAFDESLVLARTVFPFIESHNFYVEHWYHTLFWNKVREFGALLARHAFLAEAEDVFYLRHDEVRSALAELRISRSSSADALRGPLYWPRIVARRRSIHEAMRTWEPPPALGAVPETVAEPSMVMLWGITPERIQEWLGAVDGKAGRELTGLAGSPGVIEGRARVIVHADELEELEQGEILVAATTSTSWTPAFGRIAAAVSDVGGIMSHAAIVAREYRLPAVVGTGIGTKRIKTGDRLRVDGGAGVVTILD